MNCDLQVLEAVSTNPGWKGMPCGISYQVGPVLALARGGQMPSGLDAWVPHGTFSRPTEVSRRPERRRTEAFGRFRFLQRMLGARLGSSGVNQND